MRVCAGKGLKGVLGAKILRVPQSIWGPSSACQQAPEVMRDQRKAMSKTVEE